MHSFLNLVFFRFGAIVAEAKLKTKTDEIEAALLHRDQVRDELLMSSKKLMESNQNFQTTVLSGWVKQQKFKKKSQQRDLQFELATTRRKQLLDDLSLERAKQIVRLQLNEFEQKQLLNIDDLTAINQTINKPIVENQVEFLKRLEVSFKKLSNADDAQLFVNKLKQKFAEQRSANQAKKHIRTSNVIDNTEPEIDDDATNENSAIVDQAPNAQVDDLDSDDDDADMSTYYQKLQPRSELTANDSKSIVAETDSATAVVEKANPPSDSTADDVEKFCGSIVLDISDSIVRDDVSISRSVDKGKATLYFSTESLFKTPDLLAASLQQIILDTSHESKIDELYSLPDVWPCYTAMGGNIGKLNVQSNRDENASVQRKVDTVNSTCNALGQILLQVCPSNEMKVAPPHVRFPSLALTTSELETSGSHLPQDFPAITIIHFPQAHNYYDLKPVLEAVVTWCGDGVVVWDSIKALKCGMRLLDILNKQGDQISLSALIESVGDIKWIALLNQIESVYVPTPQALRVIAEIGDITSRILSTANTATVANKKKNSTLPFCHSSLAILLAQTLWLRQHVINSVRFLCGSANIDNFDSSFDKSVVVLAEPLFEGALANNLDRSDPMFVRVFDWFIRGSRRDNVGKDDSTLLQAIDLDILSKNASKKVKAKAIDEIVLEASPIRSIVALYHSSTTPIAANDPAATFSSFTSLDVAQLLNAEPSYLSSYIEAIFSYFHSTKPAETSKAAASTRGKAPKSVFSPKEIDLKDRFNFPILNLRIDTNATAADESIDALSTVAIAEIMLTSTLLSLGVRPAAVVKDLNTDDLPLPVANQSSLAGLLDAHYQEELLALRRQRRRQLPATDRLTISHLSGNEVLNVDEFVRTYFQFQSHYHHTSVQLGAQTMVIDLVLQHLELSVLTEQQKLRAPANSSETMFSKICESVAVNLKATTGLASLFSCLDDLVCLLGDSLDNKHMAFLQMTEKFSFAVSAHADDAYCSLGEAVRGYAMLLLKQFSERSALLTTVSDLVAQAGYDFQTYPFLATFDNVSRETIESKQRDCRVILAKIHNQCPDFARSSLDISAWEKLLDNDFLVAFTTSSPVAYSAIRSLFDDALDQALAVLNGISASYEVIKQVKLRADNCVVNDIRLEHKNSHQALSDWHNSLRSRLTQSSANTDLNEQLRKLLIKEPFKGKAEIPMTTRNDYNLTINDLRTVTDLVFRDNLIEEKLRYVYSQQDNETSNEIAPSSTIKDIANRLLEDCSYSFGKYSSVVLSYFTEHYARYEELCSTVVSFRTASMTEELPITTAQSDAASPRGDASVAEASMMSINSNSKLEAEASVMSNGEASNAADAIEEEAIPDKVELEREEEISHYKLLVRKLLQLIIKDALALLFSKKRLAVPMQRIYRLGESLIPGKRSSSWTFPAIPVFCSFDQYWKHALELLSESEHEMEIGKQEWKSIVEIIAIACSSEGSLSNNDLTIHAQEVLLLLCRCSGDLPSFVQNELLFQYSYASDNQAPPINFLDISKSRELLLARRLCSSDNTLNLPVDAVRFSGVSWLQSRGIEYGLEHPTPTFIDVKVASEESEHVVEGNDSRPVIKAASRSYVTIDEVICYYGLGRMTIQPLANEGVAS
jgi:hypothetical protein